MNKKNPNQTLSQQVVKGGVWVFALRTVNRGLGLVRLLILARILSPADFGLMGIALLAMATLDTFSQTGFDAALIQKKEDVESYLNSAWTITIVRGIVLFVILYLIAPYVAVFFKSPEAKPIIQVIGFSILFQAFTNVGIIYFQKELEFNKQFTYQLSGTLADFIVSVSAALILRSVWALVFGLLAGNFVRFIASYLIHPYRPRLSSDLKKVKELWGFGKWIFGTSIVSFLISQGDDLLVGKIISVGALGLYQLAYNISNMPASEITRVISMVSYPAYSKLQCDVGRLRKSYLEVLKLTSFISVPLAAGIAFASSDFTTLFLGEKWLPIIPLIQIMALLGLIRSIGATTGPVFQAVGRPGIITKLTTAKLLIFATSIYPFIITWGIVGAAWATVLNALIINPLADYYVIRIIRCSIWEFCMPLIIAVGNSLLMLVVLFSLRNFLILSITVYNFSLLIFVGILVYILMSYLSDRVFDYGIFQVMKLRIATGLKR